jgi:hypothetical protein
MSKSLPIDYTFGYHPEHMTFYYIKHKVVVKYYIKNASEAVVLLPHHNMSHIYTKLLCLYYHG